MTLLTLNDSLRKLKEPYNGIKWGSRIDTTEKNDVMDPTKTQVRQWLCWHRSRRQVVMNDKWPISESERLRRRRSNYRRWQRRRWVWPVSESEWRWRWKSNHRRWLRRQWSKGRQSIQCCRLLRNIISTRSSYFHSGIVGRDYESSVKKFVAIM